MRNPAAGVTAGFRGSWENKQYRYPTTTEKAHEIRLGPQGELLCLTSGRGEDADRVQNPGLAPEVTVRLGDDTKNATARVVEDGARRVLAAQYRGWAAGALPIEVVPEEMAVHKNERRDDA